MTREAPRIALSGINATDNPGPGVPIARSLKEWNPQVQITGLSYDVHDPGHYLPHWIDHSHLLPFPSKGWETLWSALQPIAKREGIEILIPSLDVELPIYIRHQDKLRQAGIQTFLPNAEQFELRCKDRLPELSDLIQLPHPKTYSVSSAEELIEVMRDKLPPPLVVKGRHYKAYIVYNESDALRRFTEIAAEWGCPILLQEVIRGREINLIGLADGKGGSCGMVPISKMTTTSLGKIWTGVTLDHPELIEAGRRFIEKTNWRGPFELECIEADGRIQLIEINPRFPAWVYFATGVGMNLPQRLIGLMTEGACSTNPHYEIGKYFVRYTSEMVTDLSKFSKLSIGA